RIRDGRGRGPHLRGLPRYRLAPRRAGQLAPLCASGPRCGSRTRRSKLCRRGARTRAVTRLSPRCPALTGAARRTCTAPWRRTDPLATAVGRLRFGVPHSGGTVWSVKSELERAATPLVMDFIARTLVFLIPGRGNEVPPWVASGTIFVTPASRAVVLTAEHTVSRARDQALCMGYYRRTHVVEGV